MPRILTLLFALFMLVGCQATPPQSSLWTPVSEQAGLELVSHWPGPAQQELMLVEWSHPAQGQHTLQVSSARSAKGLTMVGLSPLGQELWRAALDASGRFTASGIAPFDDPRLVKQMLVTLQLVNWPVDLLQPNLHGASLQVTDNGRLLSSPTGAILWRLSFHDNGMLVEHLAFGYRIKLRQLSLEMLEFPALEGEQK
ncbi:DUF3261 domain-containing protein [Pseudidiomarina homiensis]|uniref:DUF3261 domain-containing protein n=1 Tax=Pseudidiomarina homiensis TaxID=364198 RepID=UPI00215AF47A|nr:DUF3261 domain-containing protein [Pseudidiomarina homiensis]